MWDDHWNRYDLDRRLALGEITAEEFASIRAALQA